MIIQRPIYLKQLIDRQHNGMIKIITGMRRSGKSYLLFSLYAEYLQTQGVAPSHIIKVDLENIKLIFLALYLHFNCSHFHFIFNAFR